MDKYAVIGNPVEHSKSPHLHKIFSEQTKQNLIYEKIISPLNQFVETIENFRQSGGKGANIMAPFKKDAFAYVDTLSKAAQFAQAVNTIIFHPNKKKEGHNTDGIGLIRDLLNKQITLKNKKILLLGAGGATRGCLLPLLQELPAHVTICNRTLSKAENIAKDFATYQTLLSYCTYKELQENFDIIINGTSASLHQELLPLPQEILHTNSYCYDMAYGKEPTLFQKWATKAGVKNNYNGIGMLVEQGAESFYLWRGVRPNTTEILEKILK